MYLRCPEIARLVVVRTRPRQRSIMAKRKKEAKKAAIPQAKKKAKKAKKEGDSKSGGPPAMPAFRLDGNSGPHTLRFMESAKRHGALTAPHGKLTDAWAGVIRDLNAMGFAMSRKRGGELLQDCLDAHERRIALQDQSASPDVERVCAQLLSAKVADVKAKGETKAKRERDAVVSAARARGADDGLADAPRCLPGAGDDRGPGARPHLRGLPLRRRDFQGRADDVAPRASRRLADARRANVLAPRRL